MTREDTIGAQSEHRHDERLMPFRLGSPHRIAYEYWENWGLGDKPEGKIAADYAQEYRDAQIEAAYPIIADFQGDALGHASRLQDAAAERIAYIVGESEPSTPLAILDIGAGAGGSAVAISTAVGDNAPIELTLCDPNADSLRIAMERVPAHHRSKDAYACTDLQLPFFNLPQFDVVTATAAVHHHGTIPWDIYASLVKPGGHLVIADWHHQLWEHPARVHRYLQTFDWLNKEKGLANFLKAYPKAAEQPMPLTAEDQRAARWWMNFWRYLQQEIVHRNNPGNLKALRHFEGMRAVRHYEAGIGNAGLESIEAVQLLPDSSLLMLTSARKPQV